MSWIDAHIHMDKYSEQEIELIVQEAKQEQIAHIVSVSVDLSSSKFNRQLWQAHPHLFFPCYGYHPEQQLPTDLEERALFEWIEQRAQEGEPFAIGEVGLPYYQEQEALEKGEAFDITPYIAYLRKWFIFAQKWNKPIALHVIYGHVDMVLDLLTEIPLQNVHFHWYKGSDEATAEIVRRGYYISITPDVEYESYTQRLISQVPLTQLMVETDGPWPYEEQFTGLLTTPKFIKWTTKRIAALLNQDDEVVVNQLYQNSKQFYQIK